MVLSDEKQMRTTKSFLQSANKDNIQDGVKNTSEECTPEKRSHTYGRGGTAACHLESR